MTNYDKALDQMYNNILETAGADLDYNTGYISDYWFDGGDSWNRGAYNFVNNYVQWNNWIGGQNYIFRRHIGLKAYNFQEFSDICT